MRLRSLFYLSTRLTLLSSLITTPFLLKVMRHLQRLSLVPALDIKSLIDLAAVEDGLVASKVLRDIVKRVEQFQPEFFALLVFENGNLLNVADCS